MTELHLPEEILVQIFKRLPVKCLSRFRCVCKGWRDLIKSPFFIDMHLNCKRSYEEDYYILLAGNYESDDKNANLSFYSPTTMQRLNPPSGFPVFPHPKLHFCGPCNGIICVSDLDSGEDAIYLCNPATRECKKLPPRPTSVTFYGEFYMSMVYSVERVACGFGFDPRTDEYKVVSVLRCCYHYYYWSNDHYQKHEYYEYEIEIYDLSSHSWRQVKMDYCPSSQAGWNGTGLLFNGCLHWVYMDCYILGFDLSHEVVLNLGCSDSTVKNDAKIVRFHRTLFVVDDCLAIAHHTSRAPYGHEGLKASGISHVFEMSVYVMEDYGVESSWVRRYSFRPSLLDPKMVNPLAAIPVNHGFLLLERDDCFDGADHYESKALVFCNLLTNECREISLFPDPQNGGLELYGMQAIVITEQTLVPLS